MFGFIKKVFVVAMSFFVCNALNATPLKCVSMSVNNQEFKIRPQILNISRN